MEKEINNKNKHHLDLNLTVEKALKHLKEVKDQNLGFDLKDIRKREDEEYNHNHSEWLRKREEMISGIYATKSTVEFILDRVLFVLEKQEERWKKLERKKERAEISELLKNVKKEPCVFCKKEDETVKARFQFGDRFSWICNNCWFKHLEYKDFEPIKV